MYDGRRSNSNCSDSEILMKYPVIAMAALLSVLSLVGNSGCQSHTEPSRQAKTTGQPLKIAASYWPGQFWVEIAHEMGWFAEAGVNVELIDVNADYLGSLTEMVDGKIDANSFTLFDLMKFNLGGANLVMVLNSDNTNGAEAVLASPGIDSLQFLKGKNIGVSKGTYLEYILQTALERKGVGIDDVMLIDMLAENAEQMFSREDVDAVMTWEPFVTDILDNANARKLFDTSEIPGISPNGHAFQRKFIEQRPGDVQAYVDVWHRTTLYIKENPKQALAIISRRYNEEPGDIQAFMQQDRVLDIRDNNVAFSFGSGFESLHGAARKINDFMIENGLTDKHLDSTEFLDASFLRVLVENSH